MEFARCSSRTASEAAPKRHIPVNRCSHLFKNVMRLVWLQMLSTTVGAMGLINPMAQITEGGAFLVQDFERVPTLTPPWQHHYRPSLLGSKSTGTEVSSYPSDPVDSTTRVPVLYPHVSQLGCTPRLVVGTRWFESIRVGLWCP